MVVLGLGLGVAVYLGLKSQSAQGAPVVSVPQGPEWTRFDDLFKKWSAIYGIDWRWAKAICLNESNLGREKSVARGLAAPSDIEGSKSYDGLSWGLMQVTLRTAREMDPTATAEKLNNAEYSIKLGCEYLGKLAKMFSRVEIRYLEWVIKSYNQGPGNTRKERDGLTKGYTGDYWPRFQRNLERVEKGG